MEDITPLKMSLMVNSHVIPLNDFLKGYVVNILFAIANFFCISPNSVTVCVDSKDFHVYTDKEEIDISKKRFCETVDRKHC